VTNADRVELRPTFCSSVVLITFQVRRDTQSWMMERVARLREAVQRVRDEALRLQRNLDRAHQLQRLLATASQQAVEECVSTDDKH
jgi:hypothetical protein